MKEVVVDSNEAANLKGLNILVIKDKPLSSGTLISGLESTGAYILAASNNDEAYELLKKGHIDVILASLELVDEQCIEMIRDYKSKYPASLFYVLTGREYDSVETSQESVRMIVDDYVREPLDINRFSSMIETSIGRPENRSKSLTVVDPLVAKVKPYFLFRSPVMRRTLANLPQIAASAQTVLITGETGSGKEIVARAIHVLSSRSAGPFIPINCSAIPESLIEGELFGHEKGAFTGAVRTRKGKFETADNGTLFLDEIGDMPLLLQARLLRVLEERKIYRIGSEAPQRINVRVIAASNINLKKAVEDRLFREDLYYRLNVLHIHLPPLRERVEDIPLLAVHYLDRAFAEMGWPHPYPELSSETIYLLEHYPWKGNVRELRNIMTRIATLLPKNTRRIFPFHVMPYLDMPGRAEKYPEAAKSTSEGVFIPIGTPMDEAEDLIIKETLKHTGGNKTKAASILGVSLRNLRRKLNKA